MKTRVSGFRAIVRGVGLLLILIGAMSVAPAARADFQITGFDGSANNEDGSASTQAGEHPFELKTEFSISATTDPSGNVVPDENPRTLSVDLPAGLVGNPTAAPKCTQAQLAASPLVPPYNSCPVDSQVGFVEIDFTIGGPEPTRLKLPLYNMEAPVGTPAELGFNVVVYPTYIRTRLRTGQDYGVTAEMSPVSQATPFIGGLVTLWGVPSDPAHNGDRGVVCSSGTCFSSGQPSTADPKPFLTNPVNCSAGPLTNVLRVESWQNLGHFEEDSFVSHLPDGTPAGVEGCSQLVFNPSLSVRPTTTRADSPTGLTARLEIPQDESVEGLAETYMKRAVVTLPAGLSVNPAAADGLVGCDAAQVDLHGSGPARCPAASKIGTVEVETPLLDHLLRGSVYAASQGNNPFGSLLATYLSINDPKTGVVLKLAGHIETDPQSGQVTAIFDENPQLPFSSLDLELFGGPRAVLRTPPTCGSYETVAKFSPWSAADPQHPTSAETVTSLSRFAIDQGPQGGTCPTGAFDPKLSAGTASPVAGLFSPMALRLTRDDGSQELKSLSLELPEGLVGKIAGIPYCPEQAIAAAVDRAGEGQARAELSMPSCPAASQVGTVSAGAGAGPSPFYLNTGRVYLAGPYEGAPLSLVVVVPALAGPFDLGAVTVRTALELDPISARIHAVSDPLPSLLAGIPVDLRDLRVELDRPRFTLNPTSCDRMAFTGQAVATTGVAAPLEDRFQVGSCERLGFKPALALRITGGARRGDYQKLRAVLRARPGQANIGRASVTLPHSEFLAQEHINTVCTRVQFAADNCPAGSVYGYARAISPLLDKPLEGKVYLRSSSHPLPDLVAALKGQVEINLSGRIDSVNGGIRTRFNRVPDVPVRKFALTMKGGKKSLLVNSRNVCRSRNRATVIFEGQNGKLHTLRPLLRADCGGS